MRFLEPRARGEDIWVSGTEFRWGDGKLRIFEGPPTDEIQDFSSVLGPGAYEMTRVLTEVTDEFVVGPPGALISTPADIPGKAVFVVQEVARFLSQVLALETPVIVLHEEANRGRTLIEKFEATASEAQFAVVVLTGDDEVLPRDGQSVEIRARQNVVFEFGFFVGKLGRDRVAVLYESGVERPSDIDGLAYIQLDEAGGWKLQLERELRAAGVDADLNRLERN